MNQKFTPVASVQDCEKILKDLKKTWEKIEKVWTGNILWKQGEKSIACFDREDKILIVYGN